MRRIALPLALLAVLCGCHTGPRCQKYQAEIYTLFDTVTVVTGYAGSREEFDRYFDIIHDTMAALHRLFDIYHPYGGLNNLHTVNANAGAAPVPVAREIIDLLLLAREGYALSGGAVDITLGPVLQIWHGYRTAALDDPARAIVPTPDELRTAAEHTGMDGLVIDADAGTVFLRDAGMSLDVGSVAKAYAAQLALRAAADAGMQSALLNAGGNILTLGPPLDGTRDHWRVGIQDPDLTAGGQGILGTVQIADLAVSCSGGYQRFYTAGGRDYHHIIDPGTLMPAERYKQVTVIHRDAALADLLSTALFILSYEQGAALAAQCGAEALWVGPDGEWRTTGGYAALSSPR